MECGGNGGSRSRAEGSLESNARAYPRDEGNLEKEVAEFHGSFVNFDPIWCWPKPVQAGGPPVLMGAWSKFAPKRVAEYCDGWIPVDAGIDLAGGIESIRSEAQRRGRSADSFQ